MTWQGKRRAQLPKGWAALRKRRLEIDGYQCTDCSETETMPGTNGWPARCTERATDVDHLVGPHDHRIESLRSLCDFHHKQKTQREAARARAANPKPTQARPKAKHPGLR